MSQSVPVVRASFAEFVGTFILVFVGISAIMVNEISGGVLGLLGIAAAFGLAVSTMIYSIGDISGAHINPAVTVAFWAAGRFPASRVGLYLIAQFLGGIIAAALALLFFGNVADLGTTQPSVGTIEALGLEIVLTFILMFVIISVVTGAKEKGIMAGLAIGGAVVLDIMFGGPTTGASMNPARSLGPALLSGNLQALWLYFVGPFVGALVAIGVHIGIVGKGEE